MKIILLIINFFILSSCAGTRAVEKQQGEKKQSEVIHTVASVQADIESIKKAENSQSDHSENRTSAETEKSETTKENSEKSSVKNQIENNVRKGKVREYYENGNLKSECEFYENLSKVNAERSQWKASGESLKKSLDKISSENSRLTKWSRNLEDYLKASGTLNQKYESKIEMLEKELSKNTERDFLPWWVLLLIGYLGNYLLKFLWNKVRKSDWYLIIYKQLFKER